MSHSRIYGIHSENRSAGDFPRRATRRTISSFRCSVVRSFHRISLNSLLLYRLEYEYSCIPYAIMPLSLQRVQELLREQHERDEPFLKRRRGAPPPQPPGPPLTADERRRLLVRPLPPTLYRCPLSEAGTTLVPYASLPQRVRRKVDLATARVLVDEDEEEDDVVVEIPVAWLDPHNDGGVEDEEEPSSSSSLVAGALAGRRRQGNLRDKLTEYTRGSRLAQPFRPGGGLQHDDDDLDANEDITSPQAIARHQRVLERDTAESWRRGMLLTAPPGVSFAVGLSWQDVYGQPLETTTESEPIAATEETPVAPSSVVVEEEEETETATVQPRGTTTTSAPLFSKSYFDDDSLFGSSSNSDSDDEDDDEEEEEDENEVEKDKQGNDVKDVSAPPVTTASTTLSQANQQNDDEGEDIDGLLAELTLDPLQSKKKSVDLPTNPLELAERQARDQLNETRKEWAITKYLPIKDFDALIPNPALVYPFTLDDFQQQAVARLERNEVRTLTTIPLVPLWLMTRAHSPHARSGSRSLWRPTRRRGKPSWPNTPSPWPCVVPRVACTRPPSRRCPIRSSVISVSNSAPRTWAS